MNRKEKILDAFDRLEGISRKIKTADYIIQQIREYINKEWNNYTVVSTEGNSFGAQMKTIFGEMSKEGQNIADNIGNGYRVEVEPMVSYEYFQYSGKEIGKESVRFNLVVYFPPVSEPKNINIVGNDFSNRIGYISINIEAGESE